MFAAGAAPAQPSAGAPAGRGLTSQDEQDPLCYQNSFKFVHDAHIVLAERAANPVHKRSQGKERSKRPSCR